MNVLKLLFPLLTVFPAVLWSSGCGNTSSSPSDSDTDATDTSVDTGTDSSGSSWTSPVTEDDFPDVPREEIGEVPFNQDAVLEYHIYMDPALYEEMLHHGDDEVYREASLQVRGPGVEADFVKVGLRYKGDYSLHHCWSASGTRSFSGECAKISMKIKFSEYNKDGRFFGLKRINLNAMAEDASKLRERLVYDLFNGFGVKTSRAAHAKLYINDEDPLLVLALEQIDGRFTAVNFPDNGDGNLYKETWPSASLDEDELLSALRTNDNPEDNPDVSHFIAFGNRAAAATEETFEAEMTDWVDLDNLLRYMAVDRATKNWDGITAFYWPHRPHNNYWYFDEGGANIYQLIPWDHDKTLWEYDPYMDPVHYNGTIPVPNWNVLPLSCEWIDVWYGEVAVMPPGCNHFMNLLAAVGFERFAALGEELLNAGFDYDTMNGKVTAWAAQIADAVDEDPLLSKTSWELQVEDLLDILQKSIDDFSAHLDAGYIVETEEE